jgi:hypothetical protein
VSEAGDLVRLAKGFEHFAAHDCPQEPLYQALCRLIAQRSAALALLRAAPPEQQRGNLLLAALHDRVLAGAAPALAPYYPSVGGTRTVDDALAGALDSVLAGQHAELQAACATRSTQTNEIGRCAVLWPALQHIARTGGAQALALLDFGCSAGLNLGVDRYHYASGARHWGAPAMAGVPRVDCRLVGGAAPPEPTAATPITHRLGLDPAPVDLADAAARRWLRACLWPSDTARALRFEQAAGIALREAWPVQPAQDCAAAIEPWLDSLPPGVLPVVFNSWVLAYFGETALQAHIESMRALARRRGVAWLSAEAPTLRLGEASAPPCLDPLVPPAELAQGTLWWFTPPGGGAAELLARSHAHGHWLQWLAAG